MRTINLFELAAALGSVVLTASCTSMGRTPTAPAPETARITVLYDAFGKDVQMTKDWGYSALVEIAGKRILFDSGDDPAILAQNVKAKGVDLATLDFVVLSHRHSDHMGGFSHVRTVNPNVRVYAPKEGFGIFGSDLPGTFYRKDASLPAEMRYYNGTPPEILRFGNAFPGANIQLIDKTTEVAPGITLIALVSDAPGTKELKELSLAINTPDGIVLVVGCSHPGIENIVAEAAKINPHIRLIAGGFHLVVAQDAAIEKAATSLHEIYKVDYIAPGHCTGEPTFAAMQRMFGDHYLYAGLGTLLDLRAFPRATVDRSSAKVADEGDLVGYRTLLAGSDEWTNGDDESGLLPIPRLPPRLAVSSLRLAHSDDLILPAGAYSRRPVSGLSRPNDRPEHSAINIHNRINALDPLARNSSEPSPRGAAGQ